MRQVRAAVSALVLALVAAPAWAGFGFGSFDRPDLMDVEMGTMSQSPVTFTDVPGTVFQTNQVKVLINAAGNKFGVGAYGTVRQSPATSSNATLVWGLYEPDKVSRKAKDPGDHKNTLKQGDYLFLLVFLQTPSGTEMQYDVVPGCKAQVKVFDDDMALPAEPDRATWKVSCSKPDPLLHLGLSPQDRAEFLEIFGDTKIKIKGQSFP